ncbi:MAG: Lrp/AsnC family transcriptional regulator [Chloroflexi bacterium]|nr:Lrp/AsnC family transcriptional regulator [Chloroflexota bacterium]
MENIIKIFEALEKDARLTPDQVANMTGVPVGEVQKIIKKAEKDGTIVKYKTVINWARAGEEHVWAMVEVKVVPQKNVGFGAIAERIYLFPQVKSVYLASGTYDLAIIIEGKTMQEIALFVSEKLAPMDSVQGTVTHFILKKYKEDGVVLEDEGEPRRLGLVA